MLNYTVEYNNIHPRISLIFNYESWLQVKQDINKHIDNIDTSLKLTMVGVVVENGLIDKSKIKDINLYKEYSTLYSKWFNLLRCFNSKKEFNKYSKEYRRINGTYSVVK